MRLIALAALLLAYSAQAQDSVTLTWTNPAAYEDGFPLAAAEIVSSRVQFTREANCPGFGWVPPAGNVVQQGNAASMLVTETCLVESPASNVWAKTFSAPVVLPKRPNAPSGLSGN
jgi:hypothetical protein